MRWRVRRGLELLREELVRKHDRDWSSWSVLLLPLARLRGDIGLATAGASGVSSGMVASWTAMKATMALAAALGCAGLWLLWESGDDGTGDTLAQGQSAATPVVPARPESELDIGMAAIEPTPARTAVATPTSTEEAVTAVESVTRDLVGKVVDEKGKPVAEAKVYLVPSISTDQGEQESGRVLAQTMSDWQGAFRIAREDGLSGETADEPDLDLGVMANGFRRKFVPDVMNGRPSGELLVVLERGRTLSGRVVDEFGRPVADLELLAHTAYAGIAHVSPSQRRLRAQRRELADASSSYDQCRATTDGRGEVVFTGLPTGNLQVLPLQPGWTIEEPNIVRDDDSYVVWTAQKRLGVRLIVIDVRTGRPVDKAAATFRFEATFANGEVRDFGQWVGRGSGEVSFVLGAESLPGLEERTLTRAAFYGTVRSGESERVNWVAEAIEDPAGAVGVAEVRVEVDSLAGPSATDNEAERLEVAGTTTLELDVRYEDSAPFEGQLTVSWVSRADSSRRGRNRAEAVGIGRYRTQVPAGDLTLEVADRVASGSLPPWTDDVRGYPDRVTRVFAELPRGATASISRPDGWSGEWFVHGSWRPRGGETWQGSWGYSTDESRLILTVLRPAEWRFELRRDSALERDPLVRTVFLEEGESAVVDE